MAISIVDGVVKLGVCAGGFAVGFGKGIHNGVSRILNSSSRPAESEPHHIKGCSEPRALSVCMLLERFRAEDWDFVRRYGQRMVGNREYLSEIDPVEAARVINMTGVAIWRTAGMISPHSVTDDLKSAGALFNRIRVPHIPKWLKISVLCNRAGIEKSMGNLGRADEYVREAAAIDDTDQTVLYCRLCLASINRNGNETRAAYQRLLTYYPDAATSLGVSADPDLRYLRQLLDEEQDPASPRQIPSAKRSHYLGGTIVVLAAGFVGLSCHAIASNADVVLRVAACLAWATSGGRSIDSLTF